jgi:V/A-type H+-transporting ATPase subunit K
MNTDPSLAIAGAIVCFALSAAGSALGTGVAAAAAVGAWKKCFAQNKPAPFTLLTFVGAPMTQALYGMLLMTYISGKVKEGALISGAGLGILIMGIVVGFAIGLSAWMQGRAAAGAADAQAETGQGMANYLAALGVVEGVAIIVMIFTFFTIGAFTV